MGLDTSHGAWHGSYGAFNRFRGVVARTAGYGSLFVSGNDETEKMASRQAWIDLEEKYGPFEGKNFQGEWDVYPKDPLLVFLVHSDCDGLIRPDIAGRVASRLNELAYILPEDELVSPRENAIRLSRGLRLAAAANKPLEFR